MVKASHACLGVGCQSFVQFFKHFQHVSIGCAVDKSFIPLFWYFKYYIWIAWGILIGNVANMSLQNQPTMNMKIKTSARNTNASRFIVEVDVQDGLVLHQLPESQFGVHLRLKVTLDIACFGHEGA